MTDTRVPWLTVCVAPALLAALLFGGRLFSGIPNIVGEVASAETLGTQRQRYIADHLFGVDFFDELHGIATGYYGTVLSTRDGGKQWSWHTTGESELLRRVHMTSADQAFSVGHRGTIYRSVDGGISWAAVHREPKIKLRALAFSKSGKIGWAVGSNATILRSGDGGQTWNQQALTGYSGRDLPTWNGIALVDDNTVALVGEFGVLALSDDSGASWVIEKSPSGTTLNDIAVTPSGFLAVGLDGTALAVTRLEDEFELRALPRISTDHLFALSLDIDGNGAAVGRRSVYGINGDLFTPIVVGDTLEISYNWLADVDITRKGALWSVGRRGLVAGARSKKDVLQPVFRLGSNASISKTTRFGVDES